MSQKFAIISKNVMLLKRYTKKGFSWLSVRYIDIYSVFRVVYYTNIYEKNYTYII